MQILKDLQETLDTEDVIIIINSKHLCVSSRGIKDKNSFTSTIEYGGVFENVKYRNDFFESLTFKLDK
jgi:GTP cyclohydrolase I